MLGDSGPPLPGTFYWFRNRDVFAKEWANVQQLRWGVERWPGDMFDKSKLANLIGTAAVMGLYHHDAMDKAEHEYEQFLLNHAAIPDTSRQLSTT